MTSTKSKSRGFKSKPNTYYVDAAPTSRAHCRVCKKSVMKGERRIVTNLFVRPGRWAKAVRHVRCAPTLVAMCAQNAAGVDAEGVAV